MVYSYITHMLDLDYYKTYVFHETRWVSMAIFVCDMLDIDFNTQTKVAINIYHAIVLMQFRYFQGVMQLSIFIPSTNTGH